ncbi:stage III sporulation protein AA [Calidifontibacillus oryziterrae]|uniref:stage III sporulation protein AA n=1 Tax=Calidifontibacillus oryziterrae TaxID=1191699 RepID=UPI0002E90028
MVVNNFDSILEILPKQVEKTIRNIVPSVQHSIEEIRLRIDRPLEIIIDGLPYYPNDYIVTKEDSIQLLNKLSDYSIYAIEEELRRGYITIRGGNRVGLAGKVITEKGQVKAIRDVSSFNIRVAKQKVGIADPLLHYIYDNRWMNTILVGPPQTGKTTLLRDIARLMSTGNAEPKIPSVKVAIVDERSEIAGCIKGVPQHDFGPRIDVLDACPKAEGMMMLIRSMSPDVIIVDEIGRKEDTEAILEAIHAGVTVFVTAHGSSIKELYNRPSLEPLLNLHVFTRIIELSRKRGPGTIAAILDENGLNLADKVSVVQ